MAIGVAIIGGGIWAREEHLPAIQSSTHLKLKAVYSRSLASASSMVQGLSGVDLYSDDSDASFQDLLKRDDIEALVIALPIINQKLYIRAALSAGKHVLSEKPVAENLADANDLIKWYRLNEDIKATWYVAENWRFLSSIQAAKQEVSKLGRFLGFRVRIYDNIAKEMKFFQTGWRKTPTHQGGFLLDGGVHYVAGLRQLLEGQPRNEILHVSAFTNMLQDHLPPADTINAIIKLESGVCGTYQQSVGTTLTGSEWTVACEGGVVSVADSKVTMMRDGVADTWEVADERTGVPPEVHAWGEALTSGTALPQLEPEEALADLEIIEAMLRSGVTNGNSIQCHLQHARRFDAIST